MAKGKDKENNRDHESEKIENETSFIKEIAPQLELDQSGSKKANRSTSKESSKEISKENSSTKKSSKAIKNTDFEQGAKESAKEGARESAKVKKSNSLPIRSPMKSHWRLDGAFWGMLFIAFCFGLVLAGEETPNLNHLPGLFKNILGEPGVFLRYEFGLVLGLGSYILFLALIGLSLALLYNRTLTQVMTQIVGWILLIASACILCQQITAFEKYGPLSSGPGGTIGAWLQFQISNRFQPQGVILCQIAMVLLGLILCLDRLTWIIIRFAWTVIRFAWMVIKIICRLLKQIVVRSMRIFPLIHKTNLQIIQITQNRLNIFRSHLSSLAPINKQMSTRPANKMEISSEILQAKIGNPLSTIEPQDSNRELAIFENLTNKAPQELSISNLPQEQSSSADEELSAQLPSLELLDDMVIKKVEAHEEKLRPIAQLLEKTFQDFGLNIRVVGIHPGPVITQYEIALETGLRLTKVTALADDIALNLRVPSVRMVAPIPGKNTVGIEVPNEQRVIVRLKEIALSAQEFIRKAKLPLLLGKDSEGYPLAYDLADMPHLLIAGRTGTGKSVCLNSIIVSLLLTCTADHCKMLMIDPKQVELAEYAKLPHLMHPVVTDNSKAEAILAWGVDKMEERYNILRRCRVRNIVGYNDLTYEEILRRVKPTDEEKAKIPERMPYIVIIIDEVGDLMMAMKKEVEGHIIRLAQKSRAAGIHLILTTQRPTVDVITGLIKSNLPARICFQVADRSNSRVVLDESGAEKLLGKGDMLFLQPSTSTIVRAQGAFASDAEITRIVNFLEVENPEYDSELLKIEEKPRDPGEILESGKKRDELFEQAAEIVIREGRGSVSLLQRALGIGYGRAARLIDFLAEDGIVGSYNGAHAREVLISQEEWSKMRQPDWEVDEI